MDLRKARCLVLKDSDDSIKNLHIEAGPMLMIDCPPFSVYMIMASPRETKVILFNLYSSACRNCRSHNRVLYPEKLTADFT